MGYYLYAKGGNDHVSEDRIRGTCRLLSCRPTVITPTPMEVYRSGMAAVADLTCRANPTNGDICLLYLPRPGPGRRVLWCWSGTSLPRRLAKKQTVVVTNTGDYQHLRREGLKDVHLGPDPIFLVNRELRPLQGLFRRDTVGLCLSGNVCAHERSPGLLYASYCHLISALLARTSFDLVLLPYRCSHHDDLLLTVLQRQFRHTGRVFLRAVGNSPAIRGDLSLCRFVIGSAGATAAWSCGVPALCIGADPYATGLATDLFGDWQDSIVPLAWLKKEHDLTSTVFDFLRKEDALRKIMETTVLHRRQRSLYWDWQSVAPLREL